MSQDVETYLASVAQPWQAEVCRALHALVYRAIPGATDKIAYSKPHYYKDGKYAAVIGTAKAHVSFTIFNATDIEGPDRFFEPGPPERKTIKITQGRAVDYALLERLLAEAASRQ